jgi:hypothetical protein
MREYGGFSEDRAIAHHIGMSNDAEDPDSDPWR